MNKKNFHTLLASSFVKHPRYFIIHTPQTPFSLVSCWFKAGSCFDPRGKKGLAHMLEHLYISKTHQHSGRHRSLEYFESNGMLYSAFTGKEWTYYYLFQAPNDTMQALEMLLDRPSVFNPSLSDIESEKQIISDEISRWFNSSSSYIYTLANRGIWPRSRFGRETLGTTDSIANITKRDIDTFWNNYYGKISPQILILTPEKKSVTKLTNKINNLQNNNNNNLDIELTQTISKPLPFITNYRNSKHLQIAVSFLINNVDVNDTVIIDFINYFLANGSNSKLVQRLRFSLHSTYWVNGYSIYFKKTGCLRFVFSTDKQQFTRSLNAVLEEIEKLKSKKLTSADLVTYKKAMKTRLLKKYLQPGSIMRFYGQRFVTSIKPSVLLQTYLHAIDVMSAKSIHKVATQYLTKDKLSIAIIGSISDSEVNNIIQNYQWKD